MAGSIVPSDVQIALLCGGKVLPVISIVGMKKSHRTKGGFFKLRGSVRF